MEDINETISVKLANLQRITESDVKRYLINIDMNPVEARECSEVFLRYHNMLRDEFQKCDKAERDWYGKMFSYIHDYKQKMNRQYAVKTYQPFETDIAKYTNNKHCIEHFRGGYKQVWLSFTDEEKKKIVLGFQEQFENSGINSEVINKKTYADVKMDTIRQINKQNRESLNGFE